MFAALPPLKIPAQRSTPLSGKTSLKFGGPAALFATASDLAELKSLLIYIAANQCPWFLLGRGTNLVVSELGFEGLVIQLAGDFETIEVAGRNITVGAGAGDFALARVARDNSLTGLEFLATIPGSLGGAIRMNAGAHGSEISDLTNWVEVMDLTGEVKKLTPNELEMSYRNSLLRSKPWIVVRAGLRLQAGESSAIKALETKFKDHRKAVQPLKSNNCGSLFKNPAGEAAGRLIDQAGLKGYEVGGFKLSEKHANFLENNGAKKIDDLAKLVDHVKKKVYESSGVTLELEAEFLSS